MACTAQLGHLNKSGTSECTENKQSVALVTLLKTCAKNKDLQRGAHAHADIIRSGLLLKNRFVASSLVSMYTKCGAFWKAKEVIEELPDRDVATWSALIAGYAQGDQGEEALNFFDQMQSEGLLPDSVTFACILKACGNINALDKGENLHAEIVRRGLLEEDVVLGGALVDMYVKCGALATAKEVLEGLRVRNTVIWSALIVGYVHKNHVKEALGCIERMQQEGLSPDAITIAYILKACGNIGALNKGQKVHNYIVRKDLLDKNAVLGGALVDMYVKCGALSKAKEVHEGLLDQNVISWNALIAGFVQKELGKEALKCFDQMMCGGVFPDTVTFVCMLKGCGSMRALHRGKIIHSLVMGKVLLEGNVILGNAMVDMYVKCGALMKAKEVLEGLPTRDVVTWNALIAGYAQSKNANEALICVEQMQCDGFLPNAVTFSCILKVCASMGALSKGKSMHSNIIKQGLLTEDNGLGVALVDMYVKCGAFLHAEEVFEAICIRDVSTWFGFIIGYVQRECPEEALYYFDYMQCEGLSPCAVIFACILKACGSIGALEKGKFIHSEIVSQELLEGDIALGIALVDMYAKCGALAEATEVLEGLSERHSSSWNALIMGYVQLEHFREALMCFEWMQQEGLSPDAVTYICIFKCCGSLRALEMGKNMHFKIARLGFLEEDIVLASALVDMYVKCGALAKAREVLEVLPVRDVITWSTLITGYAQSQHAIEALNCFEGMLCEGLLPDAASFSCILKACGSIGSLHKAENILSEIVREGLLKGNVVLGGALVDMYAKCGVFDKAIEVLEGLPSRDVVSWNAVVAGYAQAQNGEQALNCFKQMQCEGVYPDVVTFICALKACGSLVALGKGTILHHKIMAEGLLRGDAVPGSAVVDMYAKCGAVGMAREVLEGLPVQSSAAWNALIAGYVEEDLGEEALSSLEQMQREGLFPDAVTCICVLKACGSIGALDKGKNLHVDVVNKGLLNQDFVLGGALIDMYGRCGALGKAKEVLEWLPIRNVIAWNAMIAGYAQRERGKEALNCYEQMQVEGLFPDEVTFLCVLTACSHSGLLDEGERHFMKMIREYGISPKLEHFTSFVHLLCNVGLPDKAITIIKKIPPSNHPPVWNALLSSCRDCGHLELGRWAFDITSHLDVKVGV